MHLLDVRTDDDGVVRVAVETDQTVVGCPDCGVLAVGHGRRVQSGGRQGRVLRGWAAWERITSWLRKKHRIGWPELRRRYCLPGTWRLAHDGQRFRGAATVTVTRYRYRGYRIPTPWTPSAEPA